MEKTGDAIKLSRKDKKEGKTAMTKRKRSESSRSRGAKMRIEGRKRIKEGYFDPRCGCASFKSLHRYGSSHF